MTEEQLKDEFLLVGKIIQHLIRRGPLSIHPTPKIYTFLLLRYCTARPELGMSKKHCTRQHRHQGKPLHMNDRRSKRCLGCIQFWACEVFWDGIS